jgi:Fe2+ or Zn2+ uptake regulation protein
MSTRDVLARSAALALPPDQIPTTDDIAGLLAQHGYRLTAPRRAVVSVVLRQPRPFTAEQLVGELKSWAPDVGRSTIYRTLEILASLDILTRVLRADGHPAYVVGAPGHRHHLVCSDCGAVVAFTRCPIDELVRDLRRDTDYDIHGHLLEVFGVCPACRLQLADIGEVRTP